MKSSIHSKLKVLVAKLYKAEKLYASMRRPPSSQSGKNSNQQISGASRLQGRPSNLRTSSIKSLSGIRPSISNDHHKDHSFSSGILIEHANEIRALEWYEVHHTFRVILNNLLSEMSRTNASLELNRIWHEFCHEFQLAEEYLIEARSIAEDAMEKEEYAHLFKVSSDLIKRKARIQALKVIHDELQVLIALDGKDKGSIDLSLFGEEESSKSTNSDSVSEKSTPSNVIPLRRKAAS
jgi:hypothetical protein